jgi:hypothetical protein
MKNKNKINSKKFFNNLLLVNLIITLIIAVSILISYLILGEVLLAIDISFRFFAILSIITISIIEVKWG